ncbi:discoidin domain-containing protein [Paenibacillus alba]|uniref:Discoidin domain-containing protein n=1 Tax=Paenibacillus alba TaxID=1197127 RepID=A0ABU6GB40_9BACL|nr:discoidin domain-containing protein [Paenibacillus alba]MEC0231409.1 discoidin domain-containing protein [Paenibacillus alba]
MAMNLALHKAVIGSSETREAVCSYAVDGEKHTFWQPTGKDRQDDKRVWLTVDLGESVSFNQIILQLKSGFISGYHIQYSDDRSSWLDAAQRDVSEGGISTTDRLVFPRVTGRYVTLEVELFDPDRDFQLIEIGVYDQPSIPSGALLKQVMFTETARGSFAREDTLSLQVSSKASFALQGVLTDGQPADLTTAQILLTSSSSEVASIDASGELTVHRSGIVQINGSVTLCGVTQETSLFIDSYDPAECIADIRLEHPAMKMEIGQPAMLEAGSSYPQLFINPAFAATARVSLVTASEGSIVFSLPDQELEANQERGFVLPGYAQPGSYEIHVECCIKGEAAEAKTYYDVFYFTVHDPQVSREQASQIVYLAEDGKLTYVPDYKGNRILDFSSSGYGGGGVKLPEAKPMIYLEPVTGDNTQHIQQAIDQLSALPQLKDGLRGAIVLRKGTYPICGALHLRSSGIVLRGEGEGTDGTLLYATGTLQRDLIQISGAPDSTLLAHTLTAVTDLYVPSGACSFHVEDASAFAVGDTVKVFRYGNARWIHAIGMDAIRLRPVAGGTIQWPPFQLEFDRVITRIAGNCLTVDAPLANAIETRWGGGAIMKYEDSQRIEQVGVENLRIDVEYDPSITDTRIDGNEGPAAYLADEQHAINGIYMDHVHNAWIRNITSYHLQHALVQVGTNTKWITIQDCAAYDFISVITGGRRYSVHLMGELTLVQRTYSETARHAFAVDARVAGPNVFLDCESRKDYNTSEPHHRWSVGCLYDNVNGRIHIQDRGWLGSGHGWSGANYVAWNTKNELVCQSPPTAQNYAIGHVGTKGNAILPNAYDRRVRKEAFWESFGTHVNPRSLYLQQLQDRLGAQAVANISEKE